MVRLRAAGYTILILIAFTIVLFIRLLQMKGHISHLNNFFQVHCDNLPCHLKATYDSGGENEVWLYFITPTYTRLEQKAELVRLSQTLMHLRNFVWIVIEDSTTKTQLVSNLLKRTGLNYVHLNVHTPDYYKPKPGEKKIYYHRGIEQRNLALNWLRANNNVQKGVFYMMDDDNTYDIEIFYFMRQIRKAGVWPVGLSGGNHYEGPICEHGTVINWYSIWKETRIFPIDMAGFAINLKVLFEKPEVYFVRNVGIGEVESQFLTELDIEYSEMQTVDPKCERILVWHTQTARPILLQNREERIQKLVLEKYSDLEV